MNTERRDDFAERWLDQALARYTESEPRAGFEEQILAGLTEADAERVPSLRRYSWTLAACAAMILLIVALFAPWRETRPSISTASVPATRPAPVRQPSPVSVVNDPQPGVTARRSHAHIAGRVVETALQPQQGSFPATAPPTEQELLLVAYLNATPVHELLAVAAEQKARRDEAEERAEAFRLGHPMPDRENNDSQPWPPEGGSIDAGASAPARERP